MNTITTTKIPGSLKWSIITILRKIDHIFAKLIVGKIWILYVFHDRLWILLWMKSISNELDITIYMIMSQLVGHCDIISNWLWRSHNNVSWVSKAQVHVYSLLFLLSFMNLICPVRNKIMSTHGMNCWCTHSSDILFFSLLAVQSGNMCLQTNCWSHWAKISWPNSRLPWPGEPLVAICWISTIPWPPIIQAVSVHLQTNCW